jgi:hypothetical protein
MTMTSQVEAVRRTVTALRLNTDRYAALVAYCETMAALIDAHPTSTTLWREYRPALLRLVSTGEDEPDESYERLVQLVSVPKRDSTSTG